MAYKIRFEIKAIDDIAGIYEYYDDTKFIARFHTKLEKLIIRLEILPSMGVPVGTLRKVVILRRFVVLYRVDGNIVKIARVFDGRTDYKNKEEL
jgi:plasmid stabilization system protein ParE